MADWFITSERRNWLVATGFQNSYDGWLVTFSLVVAVSASYASFHLVARMVSEWRSISGYGLLATGVVTMGGGHLIQAIHCYAGGASADGQSLRRGAHGLSLVLASACAFYFIAGGKRTPTRLARSGVVLGAGIGAMHFTG